jgi:hypothetical protein
MRLKDVIVIRKPLVPAARAVVDRFESEYWITFPDGYCDYMAGLGEGSVGNWVRIYPPWRISRELASWRGRVGRHWFWDKGNKLLPKARAAECIVFGDTTGGDELVFHPSRCNLLLVLPRHHEKIFAAGADVLSAIDWMCSSRKLVEPFSERNFEPFDSRKSSPAASPRSAGGSNDPAGETFNYIVKAADRWAKRHNLLQLARKQVKSPLKKLPLSQLQMTVRQQSVVFVPELSFALAFDLLDKNTGLEVGTAEVQEKSDGDSDLIITPNLETWEKLKKRYGGDAFDGL